MKTTFAGCFGSRDVDRCGVTQWYVRGLTGVTVNHVVETA